MRMAQMSALAFLVLFVVPLGEGAVRSSVSEEMANAANTLLATLSEEQLASARFQFSDDERLNWHFIPRERRGLSLGAMTDEQQELTGRLLDSGLSPGGYMKASTIMELENVLRELGGNPTVRDPNLYFVSIFGTPSDTEPWGWRFEGHHLSLNFTVVEGAPVAWSPAFFGANPARVPSGSREGLRALAPEEDLARALVLSLDAEQQRAAVVDTEAPRDIITGNAVAIDPISPAGISITDLRPDQVDRLVALVDEYLDRMEADLAAERRARLEESDLTQIAFAWAGSLNPGDAHYYRVQGPTFLIEYDNTQTDANHIHSVWRDFDGDFGRDLLRDHYASAPAAHGH